MSSESKILQARINGAKSRGPKTPEGKQASSCNAITHGLTAEAIVLDGESADAFNQHWLEFIDEHQPRTKTEHELVQRMAVSSWRLHRNYAREAAIIKLRMIEQAASIDSRYPGATPADRSALAFRSLADDARSLDLLNRYEICLTSLVTFVHSLRSLKHNLTFAMVALLALTLGIGAYGPFPSGWPSGRGIATDNC